MGAFTACGRRSLETNLREIPSFALVSRTSTPRRFPVEPLNRRSQQKTDSNSDSAGSAPNITDGEARRKRVVGIDHIIGDAGDPGAPTYLGYHGSVWANARFCD